MSQSLESVYAAILEHRDALLPALDAIDEEMPSSRHSRELRKLADRIRGCENPADLSQPAIAADWLPLLVTGIGSDSGHGRVGVIVTRYSSEIDSRRARLRFLAYPVMLFLIVVILWIAANMFITQSFRETFLQWDLNVSWPTRFLFSSSVFIDQYPILFSVALLSFLAVIFGVFYTWNRYALTTRLFNFAVAGNTAALVGMSRFTRSVADLLSVDLPLDDAIWIAGQGCKHYHFQKAAESLARHVCDGHGPIKECKAARHMPGNVVLALDSAAGPNIELLYELSRLYADRASGRFDWFGEVGPILGIVIVGGCVAFVLWAMLLPLTHFVVELT